ncbi:outer membrane protein assembly factor BamD [Deltaproteobacteria bacterium]|nr:outer membrane protein assembly factor BamD [Deltaproteobacteria bacterium]
MHPLILRLLMVAFLSVSLMGCGFIDYFYLPVSEDTAQELFEAGNDAMREKNYAAAIEYYTKLKDTYQFSPYAIEAELSLADAYFLDEEWPAAIDSYKEFESLHPRHEAIPYVLFNIGMASKNLYRSIDRPITPISDAYAYFKRITESYADSDHVENSQAMMAECRHLMAEHELYIADAYYRMGKYGPAWQRYKAVVENYKDVPEVYAFAEEKMQAAFIKYRETQAKETMERREGSWKQWFDWL